MTHFSITIIPCVTSIFSCLLINKSFSLSSSPNFYSCPFPLYTARVTTLKCETDPIKILLWFSITFIIKLKSVSAYHIWPMSTSQTLFPTFPFDSILVTLHFLLVFEYTHLTISGFLHFLLSPPFSKFSALFREALLTSCNSLDPAKPGMTPHNLNGRNLIQGTSDSGEGRTEKPNQS